MVLSILPVWSVLTGIEAGVTGNNKESRVTLYRFRWLNGIYRSYRNDIDKFDRYCYTFIPSFHLQSFHAKKRKIRESEIAFDT